MRFFSKQGGSWNVRKGFFLLFEGIFFLLVLISFANVFVNSSLYRRIVSIRGIWVLTWMGILLGFIFGGLFLFKRLTVWKKFLKEHTILMLGITVGLLFLFQLWFAKNTYTEIGWDCSTVVLQGYPEGDPFYFLTYPNNLLLAFLFQKANQVAQLLGIHNVWAVCIGINLIFIDLSIVFGALCARKILSVKGYYVSIFLLILVVGLSPYLTVPYSDTIALAFPILIFYLLLQLREQTVLWKRLVLAFLLGMVTLLGYFIKPTVIIVWIACAIWLLFQKNPKLTKARIKNGMCILAAVLIGIGVSSAIQSIAKQEVLDPYNQKELFYENEIPMTHFLMMGLHDEDGLYGAYYGTDLDTTKSIKGKQEKIEYNLSVIRQRVSDYGVIGLLEHLYHKYVWITMDGTFFYGGEGHFHRDIPKTEEGLRGLLQNITYCETPFYQQYYGQYLQALWALLLLGNGLYTIFAFRKKKMGMEWIMQISIVGLLLFLVLFEARSRYLILYLPFYVILATQGILQTMQWIRHGFTRFYLAGKKRSPHSHRNLLFRAKKPLK